MIYDKFLSILKEKYSNIKTGEFRTQMDIVSKANGPVNVILEF